ncbi:hypothetical protein [Halioxenophilus sp. WMMB6]|uniref:hypothetical protein n=1 Tax=Halioxenophilus sp. WMMB6 TaxID=3073815 RepID=UPI00295E7720|nr:hypothetical protein [Halioxenophilus sp. WMMB6]
MSSSSDELASAVVFMKGNTIAAEMLYSEFEAVLDSFIPLPDFATQNVQAVFLKIDQQLRITAAVFFFILFDRDGFPDKRWNVPLDTLADSSAHGPNLGAGPIRLACYTQCPMPWQQRNLWDPDMSPGANSFILLRKAIAENRLGLPFKPEPPPVKKEEAIPTLDAVDERRIEKALRDELADEVKVKLYRGFRNRLANTLKQQRLQLATVRNKHRQKLEAISREHQARVERLKADSKELHERIHGQNVVITELRTTIDSQAEKMSHVREYFEEKLKSAKNVGEGQVSLLNQQFELEAKARIEAATSELKEQLQLRDIEIMYLTEHQKNLVEELDSMREERNKLQEYTGDKILDDLHAAGINFVAYQTGLGHLNVSKEELTAFMDNPVAFVAEKCGVSLPTYRSWLEHFTNPVCQAIARDGSTCSRQISRITSPLDFHTGESDRCEDHRHNNVVKFQFGK